MERLLVIAVHPDDAELMFGGAIYNYVRDKNEVYEIVVTDGSSWSRENFSSAKKLVSQRKKECLNSAKILGIKKVYFLDFPDSKITEEKITDKLVSTIKEINPTVIATHGPNEGHHDHAIIYKTVCRVCNTNNEPAPIINYLYDKKLPVTNFKGLIIRWLIDKGVDETVSFIKLNKEAVAAKFKALSCYSSQFSGNELKTLLERQENILKFSGDFCNSKYAECYKVINKKCICSNKFEL